MSSGSRMVEALIERINDALPQTQCTRCGYPSCRDYARAIAADGEAINRCPPGGAQGIERLANLTQREPQALNPACGSEGPRKVAWVVEAHCIGCALCIKACPVDCIIGAPKRMHTVIESLCNGCELCIPVCPVDCIELEDVTPGSSGWSAWSQAQADGSRALFEARNTRRARLRESSDATFAQEAKAKLADLAGASSITDPVLLARKRSLIEEAIERAKAKRGSSE